MYDRTCLKEFIDVSEDQVECPVIGCNHKVERQRKYFRKKDIFLCIKHGIYISPSTFEYEKLIDNLLTVENHDLSLLSDVLKVKTESRMRRETSEDTVVWNSFRTLEKKNKLVGFTDFLQLPSNANIQAFYWSHFGEGRIWSELEKARDEFEKGNRFRTEPDLILYSKEGNWLSFIEAKTGSKVLQVFKYKGDELNRHKKQYAEHHLFKEIFDKQYTFNDIAVHGKHYELMRQMLVGSRLAKNLNADFLQVLLIPKSQIHDGESFGKYLVPDDSRKFKVITWNELHELFSSKLDMEILSNYLNNKTMGYKKKGEKYSLKKLLEI